jgi:hypothetical protein
MNNCTEKATISVAAWILGFVSVFRALFFANIALLSLRGAGLVDQSSSRRSDARRNLAWLFYDEVVMNRFDPRDLSCNLCGSVGILFGINKSA